MRGNTFGQFLTLTSFGESHGVALGAVVDGCPAGLALTLDDFATALARRRPGQSDITTARSETDEPELLSGVFDGLTLGTPIAVLVRNRDARSQDYDPKYYRTGHADRVWEDKYGHRDWRGGGRASGRETLARVIGGVVAERILGDVSIVGFTRSVGELTAEDIPHALNRDQVDEDPTRCPDSAIARLIREDLQVCKQIGDSRGGAVEVWIDGVSRGLGEPVFAKLKSRLADAVMSIGGVVGFSLGDAAADSAARGAAFHADSQAVEPGISAAANGIQGGLSNGERIAFKAFFKPPSTVGSRAKSGRHDPCIVPRAVPVVEAMTALVLADLTLARRLDRMDHAQ